MMDSHRKNDKNLAWDMHAWDFLIYFWSRIDLSFLVFDDHDADSWRDFFYYDAASDGTNSELIASDDDNAMVHGKCT